METNCRISNLPRPLLSDSFLGAYAGEIRQRQQFCSNVRKRLAGRKRLKTIADWHERYGLHFDFTQNKWHFAEWLPNAEAVWLIGDFSGWQELSEFRLHSSPGGEWQGDFPASALLPGQRYQLRVYWPGGNGWRLPSAVRQIVRGSAPDGSLVFQAQVSKESPYSWQNCRPSGITAPLIYEAHVGMAQQSPRPGTFEEFRKQILPQVAADGYNIIQLMGIAEHPYYASFGYHVTNFFAVNDLFGTPEEFKALIDDAHGYGLSVIIDLVHSHACANTEEGLSCLCGDREQFFLPGERGRHPAWGSCCFDYGKDEVLRFLLSNCRYWLEEFMIDGFRFDGVTSMLYQDHGLNRSFTCYDDYFGLNTNWDAMAYLSMANELCHECYPDCLTIAEEVSGMPGLCAAQSEGGLGFDFRLAMGVTDFWFKLLDRHDEDWPMEQLWHEVTTHRAEEKTISYVECHDQSLVGGQTFIFRCLGNAMYNAMDCPATSPAVLRGLALHKMSRLLTAMAADFGYLTFMGNEFGHPEWIDFPREGNGWSYDHARRRWDLRDNPGLCYSGLGRFEEKMLALLRDAPSFYACLPQPLKISGSDKLIAFMRGDLITICNFHPEKSFCDYLLEVPDGLYELVLDTDEVEFCGQGRIQYGQRQRSRRLEDQTSIRHCLSLYLPCRSAVIWKKIRSDLL